jgi:hypothetical protein
VYTDAFKVLASNDDGCGFRSMLTSPKLSPAMNYYVRVAGFGKTQGNYRLTITDSTDCTSRPQSDLNGDCKVDFLDYSVMASEWLACGKADPGSCL